MKDTLPTSHLQRLLIFVLFLFNLVLLDGLPAPAQTTESGTLFDQGIALERSKKYDEAIELFGKIINTHPDNYKAIAHRGFCLSEEGRYQPALADLDCAVRLKPDYFWSYYVRGFTDRRVGLDERALQDLGKAIELKGDYVECYVERGEASFTLAKYQKALADADSAIALSPSCRSAWDLRGRVFRKLGQYSQSLECYDKVISLKPDNPSAYNNRGVTYQKLKQYGRAIEDYTRAIQLKADFATALGNRGQSRRCLNQFELALEDLKAAIAINSNDLFFYSELGALYSDLGQYARCREAYDRAIALCPTDASFYEWRGMARSLEGDLVGAMKDINQSLNLEPDRSSAFRQRGSCYRRLGRFDLALCDCNKAISLRPDNAMAYCSRGLVYLRQGKDNEALADFNKALLLEPENSDFALFDLSVVYQRLGKDDKAAEYLTRLQSSPSYERHKYGIEQVKAELQGRFEEQAQVALAKSDLVLSRETPPQTLPADKASAPVKDKWALVIGISKFQRSQYDLKFAAKDAQDFYNFLTTESSFRPDHIKLLLNEQATRANIMSAFGSKWLPCVTEPGDLVVVFISTHGTPAGFDSGGRNYIVAWDTDADDPYPTAVDMDEIYRRIRQGVKTDRALIILDTCFSGNAMPDGKGLGRYSNFDVGAVQLGQGHLVISSSSANERSWESKRYANGVFTRSLIQALRTNKGRIEIKSAFETLKQSVNWEVKCDDGVAQTPQIGGDWQGSDLVISVPAAQPRSMGPVPPAAPTPEKPATKAAPGKICPPAKAPARRGQVRT